MSGFYGGRSLHSDLFSLPGGKPTSCYDLVELRVRLDLHGHVVVLHDDLECTKPIPISGNAIDGGEGLT